MPPEITLKPTPLTNDQSAANRADLFERQFEQKRSDQEQARQAREADQEKTNQEKQTKLAQQYATVNQWQAILQWRGSQARTRTLLLGGLAFLATLGYLYHQHRAAKAKRRHSPRDEWEEEPNVLQHLDADCRPGAYVCSGGGPWRRPRRKRKWAASAARTRTRCVVHEGGAGPGNPIVLPATAD